MATKGKEFTKNIRIRPDSTDLPQSDGTIKVNSSNKKLQARLGDLDRELISDDQIQDLKNKKLDDSSSNFADLGVKEITQITCESATNIASGQYFTIKSATDATSYYVWYNKDSAGGDPAPGGTGIEVAISAGESSTIVAIATAAAIHAAGSGADFDAPIPTSNIFSVTNRASGATTDAANFDVGGSFAISITTQGITGDNTKLAGFDVSGATTGTKTTFVASQTVDRTITFQDATDTVVCRDTTDTLTNKTLIDPTITGASSTYDDDSFTIRDNVDTTKKFQFEASGITTGTTRTFTVPDSDDTLVGQATADTLTNKTVSNATLTGTQKSADDAVADANATEAVTIKSGDKTAGTGDSGAITIQTGTSTGGARGNVNIDSPNTIVSGNLQVNGTTTTLNTTTLSVTDTNITVNNGGNDASSEGAGLTVDRTGTSGSIIYEDISTSKFKVGALGSEVEIADISSSQTLTNKDVDGGSASNTSRITVPKDTKANLDALTRKAGTLVFATDQNSFYGDDGTSLATIGGAGGVKATFIDPVSTSLPTGATVTIDGIAGANDDTVLFSNLSVNNNRIYKLGGVGTSISWTVQSSFNGSVDPTDGDSVRVQKGDAFAEQLAVFDSSAWKVNDVIRLFDGVSGNFWELGSIKTSTLTDNTTGDVFTVNATGSENFIVDYSIARSATKETGQAFITSDGTTVSVSKSSTFIGDTGVEFSGDISAGNIRLRYTTTNTGSAATMKYFVKRWSNAAGGPTGIPNYTGATGSTVSAAGNVEEIQFHGSSGNLEADSNFKWDNTEKSLNLNGKKTTALSSGITLNNNQVAALAVISIPHASYKHVVVEYSVERNNENRTGRLLVSSNGTSVGFSDDFVETSSLGVTFSAAVSGANIEIRYTTTSTGFTGTLKHSIRKWI